MRPVRNLDMDGLRTLVAGVDLGGFGRAAERVGRSPSAVSTRLRRLEAQVGRPLVVRAGRGLALTPEGETLLGYARRLLQLNDEALEAVRGENAEGVVRLGLPQDVAESRLAAILRRFALGHPRMRVEVEVERSDVLAARTAAGALDLALAWGAVDGPHARTVAHVPVRWIGPPGWRRDPRAADGVAFAAFSPPCAFRTVAVEALEAAGLRWRLAFTSASLSGLWAAAEGGLGVTARADLGVPSTLAVLDASAAGLPALPDMPLRLHGAEATPTAAVAHLAEIVVEAAGAAGADATSLAAAAGRRAASGRTPPW